MTMTVSLKSCSRCHSERHDDEFPTGSSWCRACHRDHMREARESQRSYSPRRRPRKPRKPLAETIVPRPHRRWEGRYSHLADDQVLALLFHHHGTTLDELAYQLVTTPAKARALVKRLGDLVDATERTVSVSPAGLTYLRQRAVLDPIKP